MRAALWENEPVPLCPRQPTAGPVTGRCGHPQPGVTLSAVHSAPAEPGGASSLTCAGPGTSFLSQRYLRSHLPCGDISGAASAQGSCRDIAALLAPAFSGLFQPRLGGKKINNKINIYTHICMYVKRGGQSALEYRSASVPAAACLARSAGKGMSWQQRGGSPTLPRHLLPSAENPSSAPRSLARHGRRSRPQHGRDGASGTRRDKGIFVLQLLTDVLLQYRGLLLCTGSAGASLVQSPAHRHPASRSLGVCCLAQRTWDVQIPLPFD